MDLKTNLLFLFIFLFCLGKLSGQETIFEEKTTIYVDEYVGGFAAHTNGFSLNFRYGKYQGAFNKRVYEMEFATLRDPKEIKVSSLYEEDARGYVYGKLNSFFTFRPSIGWHHIAIPKQSIKGVSLTTVFQVGASLGLAKPVYLNIREPKENSSPISYNVVLRKYDPEEHSQEEIYGRGSFFKGFDEIKLYPGIFVKSGLEFEYSNSREVIKALEVGLMADIYMEKVPIMAFTENRSFFLNIYVGILFGKKNTK